MEKKLGGRCLSGHGKGGGGSCLSGHGKGGGSCLSGHGKGGGSCMSALSGHGKGGGSCLSGHGKEGGGSCLACTLFVIVLKLPMQDHARKNNLWEIWIPHLQNLFRHFLVNPPPPPPAAVHLFTYSKDKILCTERPISY